MKSLVTSFFGVPSTAMNPLQREAHYAKPENDRRLNQIMRRQELRCKCTHGAFWGMEGGKCHATTKRDYRTNELVVGVPCDCVDHMSELQPDRRVP